MYSEHEHEDVRDLEGSGVQPYWSGTIAFGLVSLPVSLYAANRGRGISLRLVDDDGTPLRRQYFCPAEDKPLAPEEIQRGYEVEDGAFVVVTDEELAALQPERSREIDLRRFVDVSEIDPAYFERAYFLVPDRGAHRAYRLLATAMEDAGRVGIATFVMRDREYLVAVIAERGLLRAETLRFADELRAPDDVGLPALAEADGERVAAVERAMERLASDMLDRALLSDRRRERLVELVEAKLEAGVDVVERWDELVPEAEDEVPIDIAKILEAGLREGRAGAARGASLQGAARSQLMERTKAELYERAKELDITGRSGMTKEELIEALRNPR